jgi:hypothetical protein
MIFKFSNKVSGISSSISSSLVFTLDEAIISGD